MIEIDLTWQFVIMIELVSFQLIKIFNKFMVINDLEGIQVNCWSRVPRITVSVKV